MNRVECPAYRIDLRVNSGAWVDITAAIQSAPDIAKSVESSTGRLESDQLTVRCLVPFLEDCGLTVRDILDADDLGLRVAIFEAGKTVSAGRNIVFRGQVDDISRLSQERPGDIIDLTAHDQLSTDRTAPASTIDTAPARYTDLLDTLAGEMGLTVAEAPPLALEADTPIISHHPNPSSDPTLPVRGLAWWPNESMLVCGVGETIVGYDPATGDTYTLAIPSWPQSADPPRSIDRLWVSGDDIYGVALRTADAGLTAESYIIKADLSSWSSATTNPTPVTYTAYTDDPFRLYNAGQVKIASKEIQFRDDDQDYLAWAQVIGAAGPEHDGLPYGAYIFRDNDPQYRVAPRYWEYHVYGDTGYERTTVYPDYAGRNLYLADETEVTVEYDDSGKRQADVICYRQPGPLGYCVQGGALSAEGGEQIYDLGNGKPDADKVGTLPLTLAPGWYSFISSGQGYDTDASDGVAERVDGYSIVFAQPRRMVSAVHTDDADNPLTAEDDVDPATFADDLGPLAIVGDNEFERLYIRDVSAGSRVAVTGFPSRAYDIHLARASATDVYVAFARDDGLNGAYHRTEPLVETEIGVCHYGTSWVYTKLYTLSGWDDTLENNEGSHSHYRPTCLAWSKGTLYIGVVETIQRFVAAGVNVLDAYTRWYDDGEHYYADFARVFIEGHHTDDFEVGDRIRLWPSEPERFPYAPLPRTITSVEWNNVNGGTYQTELRISPILDVSTGELDPADREIPTGSKAGLEEYRLDSSQEWGPPTLQYEATREQRTYLYSLDLTGLTLTEVDNGQESETETVTPELDGDRSAITLAKPFATDPIITLGDTTVQSTLDETERDTTGDAIVYVPRRYAGIELTADYDYYDPGNRFEQALVVGSTLYYSRGREIRSYAGSVTEYGDAHYQAASVLSGLVAAPTAPLRLYGVAEGGLIFQLSRRLSGFVGDRSGWEDKTIPACLSELALALGCVFWCDAAGGVHFTPRGWRRNRHVVAATEIIDYTEPGAWQVPASAVTVSWPGGEETVGNLSAVRSAVNESFTADLVTSAGWAAELASHLYAKLTTLGYRAEATLRDMRLDIEVGDGVQLALYGAVSVNDGLGAVVGMSIRPGSTTLTLEG